MAGGVGREGDAPGIGMYFSIIFYFLISADMYRECDIYTRWGGVHARL